jgi:hypothetical protein
MLRSATDRQSNNAGAEAGFQRAEQRVAVAAPGTQDGAEVALRGNRRKVLNFEKRHAAKFARSVPVAAPND